VGGEPTSCGYSVVGRRLSVQLPRRLVLKPGTELTVDVELAV
jgi:hypothetical protein